MELKLYRGVVEDNNDEEFIGRVQVRIHGLHTKNNENSDDFEQVQTTDLPWAEVMGGTEFGLIGGVGLSSILRKGTWVWVLLEQGDPNKPIIIGTIKGINSESSVGKASGGEGFYDPDEKYPFEARAEETDINRLARAADLDVAYYDEASPVLALDTTMHQQIMDTLDVVEDLTDTADAEDSQADVSQTEPNSTSDASVYPDNNVLETQSGHIIEFDDTVGNERIRLIHRTGSYFEIKPDGTFVQKCVDEAAESHYIHMSSVNEHIKMSVKRYIELNVDEIIGGYVKRHIIGTVDEHITDAIKRKFDSTLDEHIIGAVTRTLDSTLTETITGAVIRTYESTIEENITEAVTRVIDTTLDETITGAVTKTLEATLEENITGAVTLNHDGDVTWNIGGALDINTTGGITVDGASLDLTASGAATLTGGTTLDLAASTGGTLDGGPTLDITGSIVNIN